MASKIKATVSAVIFLDGKTRKDKCPKSKEGKCHDCKRELEPEYGFSSGYGLGGFKRCAECGRVYDFQEDDGY